MKIADLLKNKKAWIAFAVITCAVIVYVVIRKKIRQKNSTANLQYSANELGLAPNQYKIMAQAIYDAFNVTANETWTDSPFTDSIDETAIYDQLTRLTNDADFSKLNEVFNEQNYRVRTKWELTAHERTLLECLNLLDSKEKGKVNDIFATNGLTIRI